MGPEATFDRDWNGKVAIPTQGVRRGDLPLVGARASTDRRLILGRRSLLPEEQLLLTNE